MPDKTMMKYSVIIPIYNAAQTLSRCLDSLVCQLREDVELLLVDDGSDDASGEICAGYARGRSEIRLLSKENGGVSSARNLGLDHARGEYVLFVDADDAVREDYFSTLDEALRARPELLIFSMRLMGAPSDNRRHRQSVSCFDQESASRLLSSSLRKQKLNLITTKAFRRDLIKAGRLRFDERLDIGEDKVFALAFSLLATRVRRIGTPLYCLCVDNPDSLSRRKREDLCDSVLLEHRLMSELLAQAKLPEDCKKRYQNAISYSFYRSAYTVVGELRKYEISASDRRKRAAAILAQYSEKTEYPVREFFCGIISLPIRRKQVLLVDQATSLYAKRGFR